MAFISRDGQWRVQEERGRLVIYQKVRGTWLSLDTCRTVAEVAQRLRELGGPDISELVED